MLIPATHVLSVSGAMVQLYDNIASGAIASWDVQNISQIYNHLHMRLVSRGDVVATTAQALLRFNNDSGANYDYNLLRLVDTTVSGVSGVGEAEIALGATAASLATAGNASHSTIDVMDYKGTTFNKGVVISSVIFESTLAAGSHGDRDAGQWRSTAAINRITVLLDTGNFIAGSRLTIYGLL